MCLERVNLQRIADKEVICYKIVRKDMTSPCYNFKYELGETYHSELSLPNNTGDIKRGLHTFVTLEGAIEGLNVNWIDQTSPIPEFDYNFAEIILECTIPIGARYYSGECWLDHMGAIMKKGYASNTLVINKIVDI